jgi:hypothetical protein
MGGVDWNEIYRLTKRRMAVQRKLRDCLLEHAPWWAATALDWDATRGAALRALACRDLQIDVPFLQSLVEEAEHVQAEELRLVSGPAFDLQVYMDLANSYIAKHS